MKKAVSLFASLFFSLIVMLTVTSPSAAAEGTSSMKSQVFSYLTENLGFNAAASCGIMANMEQESNFNAARVIIDSNGLPSGGLCQWNGSRYRNLINFCNNNGYNHLGIKGQLEYLKHELKKDYYKHIFNYLKSVPDSSGGAYDAAYYWCYHFEVPSNRTSKSYSRAASAVNSYWPRFGGSNISALTPSSAADGQTLDLGETVTVTWTQAGGNVTDYLASIAEKKGDDFDWENATVKKLPAGATTLTLPLSELGSGRFAVRVFGHNAYNGAKGKCKNTIKFTAVCLQHQFSLTKRTEPTFAEKGKYVYTCDKCGAKKTESKARLSADAFRNGAVMNFAVTDKSDTTVTVTWDAYPGAQGYRIYQLVDDAWVKLRRMEADELVCKIKNLKSGEKYTFKVAAYCKNDGETLYSKGDTASAITRPDSVRLVGIDNGRGKVWLKWENSSQAEGYTIYASKKPGSGFKAVATAKKGATEMTVKPLQEGVRYYFQVRAYITNAKGQKIHSDPSNVMYAVVW